MSIIGGKVVRDGHVAVLVSGGYGAGWSTWGSVSVFDPDMVEAVERGDSPEQLVALAETLYPEEYVGGAEQLSVRWIPEGTLFRIEEYDGSESLELASNVQWMEA